MKTCIVALLIFSIIITFSSCKTSSLPDEPEDFSFFIRWGVYGISSYDSETGKLVKTTDARDPEDFVTCYKMSEDELKRVYELIRDLDIEKYPDEYDPNIGLSSDPFATVVLSVRVGDVEKTVTAEEIALGYEANTHKGQKFLNTVKEIVDILTATEEWKALPVYEVIYD